MNRLKQVKIRQKDDEKIVGCIQNIIRSLNPGLKNIKLSRSMLITEMVEYIIEEANKHGIRHDTCESANNNRKTWQNTRDN